MAPYQHIFSAHTVLNVWRNLRATRDQHDLLLTFQYHPDEAKARTRLTDEDGSKTVNRKAKDIAKDGRVDGRSIGFVVPWRSMQAQKKELKEREKELAEALVALAGEVAFTDLPESLQSSCTQNPLIQVRHLAAGISRQMSKVELQMADNAPFARGKNLYTGGEIIRRFLPAIKMLFSQRPVPQRMIFELLIEMKDLVFQGMVDSDQEVTEWELNNFTAFEDLDEAISVAITPVRPENNSPDGRKKIKGKEDELPPRPWLQDETELLYHLESLETTSTALSHLPTPVQDFCAKSIITLRRMLDRRSLTDFSMSKKRRTGRCSDDARCMKWASASWKQGGGCRRGCIPEDEDPKALPCWHSTSRHFDRNGTYMVGGGKPSRALEDGMETLRLKE